ncbi:putative zinc finger domain-containing MYND-type [Rosellinia necatrix]|uniref:ribonuclease H n=1 Tax=Rosellinia necatrix TaxID=77044 RepID=A0A1W2TFR8_ROSNE|nr:putative zinc finger domain-containing MYND-type [Rosellinia necatrix]
MALSEDIPSGLAMKSGCPVCYPRLRPQTQLLQCSGCKVIHYCSTDHQKKHRPEHKAACTSIIKSRAKLEKEDAALRTHPGDFLTPANIFEVGVGRFWGMIGTRDYMRARFAAANALLQIDTIKAVEKALAHFQDMLRLCRSDNLGIRDIVPSLLLRLGREQECYDFLKWWSVIDDEHHYNGKYDWGDPSLPYLDICGADAFEAVDFFASHSNLCQFVTLVLLKLRLYLDIEPYDPQYMDFGSPRLSWPPSPTQFLRPIGEIVQKKVGTITSSDVPEISKRLKDQYQALFQIVHKENPYFWEALVDASEDAPSLPTVYSPGSVEEAILTVYQCKKAWEESYDAIIMIESEIGKLTKVYKGPDATVVDRANTGAITATLERRRGSGRTFPSKFDAPTTYTRPENLFPPTLTGQDQTCHFVHRSNQKKALAYADGACSDNGQQNPQAAWAAVLRLPSGDHIRPCILSGRLELKGPFGDESIATSNRAELRAAIAILRGNNWLVDGFTSVVIATDSSYLVDGATEWVRGWVRNGWKTRAGGPVKNRDLWELFLGEVEKCAEMGLDVELWKIPREMNGIADTAAKETIHQGPAPTDFENMRFGPSAAGAGTPEEPRVLCLCLEYESLFNDMYTSLISRITAKAKMDRVTTREAALDTLTQNPPPPVILVTDAGAAKIITIWERVIDCLRGGSTVVLAVSFSSFVNEGQFNRCFGKIGLPWKRGGYHRTNVSLRPGAVDDRLRNLLLPIYSQKALYVEGVASSDVWYAGEQGEVAVAFTKVGNGMLGYVGDVNREDGSEAVILAMLGLLN